MFAAGLNFFASGNAIVKFNGLNYANWFEQIHFHMEVMDLDMALMTDEKPAAITETSTENEKAHYELWEKSNRLSLNLMRMTMAENLKPSMWKTENAREFMKTIKEHSQSDLADKSIMGSIMGKLTTKKFDWSKPIHDHVTEMANLVAKLKTMGMEVSESFLVHFIINSLPPKFGQFHVDYTTLLLPGNPKHEGTIDWVSFLSAVHKVS